MVSFGPLSVIPEFQGKGVGSRLVKHSTNVAKEMGIHAFVIYGNPHYYGRCGFRSGDKYDITNMKQRRILLCSTSLTVAGGCFGRCKWRISRTWPL